MGFPMMALRKEFLRQHYLDQVQRVFRVPRETLSLAPITTPVGSPNNSEVRMVRPTRQVVQNNKIFAGRLTSPRLEI